MKTKLLLDINKEHQNIKEMTGICFRQVQPLNELFHNWNRSINQVGCIKLKVDVLKSFLHLFLKEEVVLDDNSDVVHDYLLSKLDIIDQE